MTVELRPLGIHCAMINTYCYEEPKNVTPVTYDPTKRLDTYIYQDHTQGKSLHVSCVIGLDKCIHMEVGTSDSGN